MTTDIARSTSPVISVDGIGVRFSKSSRHRSLRDTLLRRTNGSASGQFWGLRNVSFDVYAGECVGVVGANGQGKSTLLKLIAGVLLPDEGRLSVSEGVAPLIEITGGFVGDLTVRDNIQLRAGLHGMSKKVIAERFDEMIDFAGVGEFVDMPYKHLSSGMKARVAFAVVSRLDEPIILADEVLAVGDKAFKRKCYDRLESLIGEGRTLFLVSHSERDLRRFCTRGLYIRKGELISDSDITSVLDQYAQERA